MKYAFIEQHCQAFSIQRMCAFLGVTRSGYYAWRQRGGEPSHPAAAVILVHNHPSGDPEPSDADRRITQRLKEALDLVEIRVIDHIVVGMEGCESFAELGYLRD